MRPALVLLNPNAAGGRAAKLAPAIAEVARSRGSELAVTETLEAARARLRAAAPGSRVVVAGGDGTLQRLLPALLDGGFEIGLLPCGSGNDVARAYGLRGLDWRSALDHALTAPSSRVDLGLAGHDGGSTPFASSLCAGFDAAVSERALRAPRWLRGLPRYLWATVAEIAALQPGSLRVCGDGALWHDGPALFASTLVTSTYGSGMPAAPAARIDDGRLDLVLAGRFGRVGTLAMMPLLLTALHVRHPRVRIETYSELVVESERPLPLAADGEPLPPSRRLRVRVLPQALAIVRRGG